MVYYSYYARRLEDDVYQLPTTFCGHLPISFSLGVAFKKAFGSYISRMWLHLKKGSPIKKLKILQMWPAGAATLEIMIVRVRLCALCCKF